VAEVRPGDRVLHYAANAKGGPAIVGWSEAVDLPSTGTITWQARGTRGRARAHAITGPSWYVPLGGFHPLAMTVRGRDLNVIEEELSAVRSGLEAEHGKPVYFPFFQYHPGEIRAQQGYLVKFPAALFDLLHELDAVRSNVGAVEGSGALLGKAELAEKPAPTGELMRTQDPELRVAIEQHAVERAIAHYAALGATDIVTLGKPYDIRLKLDGTERHVEVKGSARDIAQVELTVNEVSHARDFQPTDLIVVESIEWSKNADGTVVTAGGQLRIWRDWSPEEAALSAQKFVYSLPSGGRTGPAADPHAA